MHGLYSLLTLMVAFLGAQVVAMADEPNSPPPTQPMARQMSGVFEINAEGSAPIRIVHAGIREGEGLLRYEGQERASDGSWDVRWSYLADLDPNGKASIRGFAQFANRSNEKQTVKLRLALPINPVIGNKSELGGKFTVSFEMDEGGGVLEVPAHQAGWMAMVDEEAVKALHPGPFVIRGAEKGMAKTTAGFGGDRTSVESPSVEDGFGIRHHFRISCGDAVTYTSELVLAGAKEDFLRRRETRNPITIGEGEGRLLIELSKSRRAPLRKQGKLVVRPAHVRDHNSIGRAK